MVVRANNLFRLSLLLSLVSRTALCFFFLVPSTLAQTTSEAVNYQELLKSANLAFETGDFDRAIVEFSTLYNSFPEDPSISNNYAVALFEAGQHANAAAVIQDFLSEHSEVGEITTNLFTIYDYMASESYALLNGVEPELPDLRLSDSAPNISSDESPSRQQNSTANVNEAKNDIAGSISDNARSAEISQVGSIVEQLNRSTPVSNEVIASLSNNEAKPVENNISISPVPEESTVPVSPLDAAIIENRLNDYIQAWTEGDVNRYLSFYYPSISPVVGVSYSDWYQNRIERIFPERQIELSIDELRVHFESGEDVIMEYLQRYRSSNYSDRTLKQMRWRKYQGVWYIRNEKSLPR